MRRTLYEIKCARVAELSAEGGIGRPAGRQARSQQNMYHVYVLELENGTFYKGLTNNLKRRFSQHETGQCTATKKYLPCKLIYFEVVHDRITARRREKSLKSGSGREFIRSMVNARVAELADAQS